RLAVGHRAAAQEAVQAGGEVLADAPAVVIVRQPPQREDRQVTRGNDVRAEPWPPELQQRWIFPGGGLGPVDTSVDRQQRGAEHSPLPRSVSASARSWSAEPQAVPYPRSSSGAST